MRFSLENLFFMINRQTDRQNYFRNYNLSMDVINIWNEEMNNLLMCIPLKRKI